MYLHDPGKRRALEAWKLRVLLLGGVFILLFDAVNEYALGLPISPGLAVYLTIASGYFALAPQRRIEKSRENVLLAVLFPGAFVTALLPFYLVILFILRRGW